MKEDIDTVDFGHIRVKHGEKSGLVREVFSEVSETYDLFNDVASLGLHRLWKKYAIWLLNLRSGEHLLDVASGSGDLAIKATEMVGPSGTVVMCDINERMLEQGRNRCLDQGRLIPLVKADAESLPFMDDSFDKLTIGFGLRNITDKTRALKEFKRVLRPGGKALILEFSQMSEGNPVKKVYDWYSFNILPKLGELTAGKSGPYTYLVESIREYPVPNQISELLKSVGFSSVRLQPLFPGGVTVHQVTK
ncbi:MAG: bifunctional demethylmenaquinone methyltransferase/2-methoxy-6-polyprenyl-1,4-benzoquinol methylase UbiE [Proteobacteria bacterium]|nr:bifunctional demethylmenaquinone methyltransferase/2-methoxy-6-polyprenyl-1,4-benzoquinol methylase UbiE [Pseudomonadota bacterium]|tara:strand:+ start:94 stop:840 length:747 start_codon:yes stop_codon:yes gene_type:complete